MPTMVVASRPFIDTMVMFDLLISTFSVNVPSPTRMVSPADAASIAAWIDWPSSTIQVVAPLPPLSIETFSKPSMVMASTCAGVMPASRTSSSLPPPP